MVRRVRPRDIGTRASNVSLAKRKLREVRCQLYYDQVELIDEWCRDYNITPTGVMRKLFNYFLHIDGKTRKSIIERY